jgi:nucleoside-diphosphate-sugar epimerase
VTYWAGHEKATAELGFEPRPIEAGLRDTFRPG